MLKKYVFAAAAAALFSCTIAAAQNPPPGSPPPPTSQPPAAQEPRSTPEPMGTTVTLEGCLYREQDVPGRTPNVAERAGVLEDYILADAKIATGQSATPSPTGTSGVAGGTVAPSSIATMYKVEKIADERLRAVVGKRVEVTGRIDAGASDTNRPTGTAGATPSPDRNPASPDRIEIPEFEATDVKEIAGSCPATPARK
jgi:hypothetical protein